MKAHPITDVLALRIMLQAKTKVQRDRELAALAAQVRVRAENRDECPECGSKAEKEDNGIRRGRVNFTLLCVECGTQFEPQE